MNVEPTNPTPSPESDQRRPLTLRAGAFSVFLAILWGGTPVAIKAGLSDSGPFRLGALRMFLGGIVVLIYAVATRESLRPKRSEWLPLGGLAVIYTGQTALLYFGSEHSTSGHAAVLIATFPLWSAIFAHFVVPNDEISKIRALGTLIAYGGVMVVLSDHLVGGEEGLSGNLMLLSSALLIGLQQVYLSQTSQEIPVSRLLMTQSVALVIVFVPLSLLLESEPWTFSAAFIGAALYQGVVVAGFCFLGNTWLLQRFLPSRVTATQLPTAAFGVLFSWLILGEPIGLELIIGMIMLTVGSALAQHHVQEVV